MKKTVMACMVLLLGSVPAWAQGDFQAQQVSDFKWGFETSYIEYTESSLDVKEEGVMLNLFGDYNYRPDTTFFDVFHLDGRFGIGRVNYEGSGKIDDILDYTLEPRAWIGKDIPLCSTASITPYAGIGYRILFDDLSGKTSSTGAQGYLRRSQYIYVPLGVELKTDFSGWQLGVNAEYDLFIHGWQTSYLSDIPGFPDITNNQKKGYGLRGSIDVVKKMDNFDFSVSPFVRFWHIEQSDTTTATGSLFQISGYEPENKSIEIGVKLGFAF